MPATINPYEVLKDDASTSHPERKLKFLWISPENLLFDLSLPPSPL